MMHIGAEENAAACKNARSAFSSPTTRLMAVQNDVSILPLMRDAPVVLHGKAKHCLVLGKKKPPLSDSEYAVVRALVNAFPKGIAPSDLEKIAGVEAHETIARLRKKDSGWAEVILMPSRSRRVGYRLINRTDSRP